MININPAKFIREVRAEIGRVTWPSKQETVSTAIGVFVMVFIAMLFFTASDMVIYSVIKKLVGLEV
ncbi:MAG: preprotein translocase subunit SecE [Holosporales bacterium]|jgi:preprotein translocase subunit SecE|nr:preprotein translocase subunit SecE [Holosporales bacterium]